MRFLPDLIIAAGLLVVATGIWWIYPPAALIFGGFGLCIIGWHLSK